MEPSEAEVIPGTFLPPGPPSPAKGVTSPGALQTSPRLARGRQVAREQVSSRKEAGKLSLQDRQVWAGDHYIQSTPGNQGQGLQNPAVSGAGVPRSSPGFCRRVSFSGKSRLREPEESETSAHSSLGEGTELHDSSPGPAGYHWHSAGPPRGGPRQGITIQHVGTQAGCLGGPRGGSKVAFEESPRASQRR